MTKDVALFHFSPMPPSRNGIADYAYQVIDQLSGRYPSRVFSSDPFAIVPNGTTSADPLQAFRFVGENSCCIHQIGNNPDHAFAIRSAKDFPGIVVLHDLKLLYLHEFLEISETETFHLLGRSNPSLARTQAARIAFQGRKTRVDYLLFDMLADVIDVAKCIVVHSRFAKAILARHYGDDASRKVRVIPHFAFQATGEPRDVARLRLSLEPDWFVVVTLGFATKAKRYDWLVEALDRIVAARPNVVWVQAGPVRPDDYDLPALLDRYPRVRAIARMAGFVSSEDLDAYVAAADVVVNLRFPSVGESSGILARAMSAGACCIVTDTAGYSEYPDDVAIRLSPFSGHETLYATLTHLMDAPEVIRAFAHNARRYAATELSIATYTASLEAAIHEVVQGGGAPLQREMPHLKARRHIEYQEASRRSAPGAPVRFSLAQIEPVLEGFNNLKALAPEALRIEKAEFVPRNDGEASDDHGNIYLELTGQRLG
ncbi:MAG: glycosyltransferase family 4 protein [Rhizobiales bacterium]|nr:glycosyltransferase family 4 protein [Hyphomicrobiales bacterium]